MIVDDVVDLNGAGVDVAQDEIGCTSGVNWRNAGILPVQTDGSDEGRAGELIVINVIDFQPAGIDVAQGTIGSAGVAQDHVAFAETAEIADAGKLPIQADSIPARSYRRYCPLAEAGSARRSRGDRPAQLLSSTQ